MNRNMIRQIRQQQMKRKERAGQEKIVHRVQIVAAQRGQDEYQKEKEEQRRGPEIADPPRQRTGRSEEHTSELQSHLNLVCRLLLEKKKKDDSENPTMCN